MGSIMQDFYATAIPRKCENILTPYYVAAWNGNLDHLAFLWPHFKVSFEYLIDFFGCTFYQKIETWKNPKLEKARSSKIPKARNTKECHYQNCRRPPETWRLPNTEERLKARKYRKPEKTSRRLQSVKSNLYPPNVLLSNSLLLTYV